jgi:protein-tyrosine phosphatase
MNVTAIDDDGRLFVSSAIDDWTVLRELGITVVVDLEGSVDEGIPARPGGILYVYFPFEDDALPEPGVLDASADYVARLLESGYRVLVHCSMGLNRSPLLAALVLHRQGWSGAEAVERLCERRPGALFNPRYREHLLGLAAPASRL